MILFKSGQYLKKVKKNQTITMDNATFHKRKSTLDLFAKAGIEVSFLPPYSPISIRKSRFGQT
jgi:transposase